MKKAVKQRERGGKSRGSFACGLPGGCGNGQCVKSRTGVTCQCNRGWMKSRQGKCSIRK